MQRFVSTGCSLFLLPASIALAAPLACLIEPDKVAELGAPRIGILDKVVVERGDTIKAGQVVAYLKADVERAALNVARVRSQAEADLAAAKANLELAQSKLARSQHLVDVGFISKEALDQARAEERIAKNRVLQAEEAQRMTQQELALSNSQLAQHVIRAPFEGVVMDRFRTEGERVEREAVVKIAKINPLRVEVVMPSSAYGHVQVGHQVSVRTDITGEQALNAKVVLVDRVLDAASDTFRVRLSLPNPGNGIPAGLRCMAEFNLPLPAQPGAASEVVRNQSTSRPGIARASLNAQSQPAPASRPEAPGEAARFGMKLSYQLQTSPKY